MSHLPGHIVDDNSAALQTMDHTVRVAGRLAHDFGNYLTGILGFTELAAKHVPDGTLAQHHLKEVWQAAKNASTWVQRLQLLTRSRPVHVEAAELTALARAEEARVRALADDAVNFVTFLEPELPLIDVAGGVASQVLAELVDNGRESAPRNSLVTLAARRVELDEDACAQLLGSPQPGTFVEVVVTDAGTGIPADTTRRLLTECFVTTKAGHRGVGLLIVLRVMQQYGGGLFLGSHGQKGSVARVYFPAAPAPRPDVLIAKSM